MLSGLHFHTNARLHTVNCRNESWLLRLTLSSPEPHLQREMYQFPSGLRSNHWNYWNHHHRSPSGIGNSFAILLRSCCCCFGGGGRCAFECLGLGPRFCRRRGVRIQLRPGPALHTLASHGRSFNRNRHQGSIHPFAMECILQYLCWSRSCLLCSFW